VGRIDCGPKVKGELTDHDRHLLQTLAAQASLAARNARLAAELSRRLTEIQRQASELAASRARIVQAQDAERRRIERNIHDGAQQELVGLMAKLRLARNQLHGAPERADVTLRELQAETRLVLAGLRELAQGIHPSVLSDRGLVEAVATRTDRMPIPFR
jgi:signal transduction histidine kinase